MDLNRVQESKHAPIWTTRGRIKTNPEQFSVYSLDRKMIPSSSDNEKTIGMSPNMTQIFMMRSKIPTKFILREMILSDGPAINVLASQCPDGGLVSVRSVFRKNAWQSLKALRPDTVGVAAESPGYDGLIGMGWLSFGHCRVDGVTVPYALLNTLMVHPNRRRHGIAGHLSNRLIEYARARFWQCGLTDGRRSDRE